MRNNKIYRPITDNVNYSEEYKKYEKEIEEKCIKLENEIIDLKREIEEKEAKNKKLEKKINFLKKEIEEKEEKNFKLENEIKEMKKKINSQYNNNLTEGIEKNISFEKGNKNLNQKNENVEEINEEQKIIINLQNEMKDLKKNMKEKSDKIDEDIRKNNILIKEIKQYNIKFDGVLKQYFENSDENRQLKEELEKYKDYESKNEKLSNHLNKLISQNETKMEYIKNSSSKYYDVVIDINSINSLRNEGWDILYNEDRKENYEKIVHEKTIKVGVLGLSNVGKSYLLSKIINAEIPKGYTIETKGISIKYSQEEKGEEAGICILDTAGLETPLLNRDKLNKKENEEFNNMIELKKIESQLAWDKTQTELFIQNLIISFSDIIILVVGKLTRIEQKLITRIKNMAKMNEEKIKSIIIVHNLAHYSKNIEVENYINNYLLNSATFKLIKKKVIGIREFSERFYFVDQSDDIKSFHYIMAKEETEAGKYYNKLTQQLIKIQFSNSNFGSEIDILEQIKRQFCELSEKIIGEKIYISQLETIDDKKMKIKDISELIIKNNDLDNFQFQYSYIDNENYLKEKVKDYEPKYSLYIYKEGDDDDFENYLLLRIEVPGNITKLTARGTDPRKERYRGIIINIQKKEDDFEEKVEKFKSFHKIYDNRRYEEIYYFIELKGNLMLSKRFPIEDTEIYKIKFDKRNKEKYFENFGKYNQKNENMIESKMIASGVYVLKFALTEDSF